MLDGILDIIGFLEGNTASPVAKKPAVVAALSEPVPFPSSEWGPDETWLKYAQDLKTTYGITKKYFTVERANQSLLTTLSKRYQVKTASYNDVIPAFSHNADAVAQDPEFSHLVILDPLVDAFYFNWASENPDKQNRVIIFFDTAEEFKKFYVPPELRDYSVPMGNYELVSGMMGFEMVPLKVGSGVPPIIDTQLMDSLTTDTEVFFGNRDFYKANGLPHKRGILLFGTPGVGKSVLSKYYLNKMSNVYGILIDCGKISFGAELINYLDMVCGSKPKLLVMEDVDGACSGYGGRSAFLNFLDGPRELDNTLVFATTNYPERLDSAILDRPSRFDAVYLLDLPGPELRRQFLLRWFLELEAEPQRLDSLVVATDGFSGAFYKELFLLAGLRKCTIEEALAAIHERKKMVDKFRDVKKPEWGNGGGPVEAPMQGSLSEKCATISDMEIDRDTAMSLIASLRKKFNSNLKAVQDAYNFLVHPATGKLIGPWFGDNSSNDIRHRVAASASVKWWLSPDGQVDSWPAGDVQHEDRVPGGFKTMNQAINKGWTRGESSEGNVIINSVSWARAEKALKSLPQELRFGKFLLLETKDMYGDFYKFPILEDEDALDAYNNREDVRHRVKAAFTPKLATPSDGERFVAALNAVLPPSISAKLVGSLSDGKPQSKDIDIAIDVDEEFLNAPGEETSGKEILAPYMKKIGAKHLQNVDPNGENTWWRWEGMVVDVFFGAEGIEASDDGVYEKYGEKTHWVAWFPDQIHIVKVTRRELEASLRADKFSTLYREANRLAGEDPAKNDALSDPAKAQAYGAFQKAINEARDEDSLRLAWEQFKPSTPWEQVESAANQGAPKGGNSEKVENTTKSGIFES